MKIAVIGAGEWGKNYVRILHTHTEISDLLVVETNEKRHPWLQQQFPDLAISRDPESAFADDIDAVVIALPASMHKEYLKKAIVANKHILVEKPAVVTLAEGEALASLVSGFDKILMVGHVFLFNPGIIKLKQLIDDQILAPVYFMNFVRTNLGPIRADVNALYDLAPHDISIMLYLLDEMPVEVTAIGSAILSKNNADVVFANYRFASGKVVGIQVSWLAPKKIRELTIVGEKRMALFDDAAPNEKLRIYEKSVEVRPDYSDYGQFQMIVQDGDVHIPKLPPAEPLREQVDDFIGCVKSGDRPLTDWQNGMDVVRVLCATQASLEQNGQPVSISAIDPIAG